MPAPMHPPIETAANVDTVPRNERWIVAALVALLVCAVAIGWATTPTDAELLVVATTHADIETRIEAMNSLVVRGYWQERPPAELKEFLNTSPPALRGFIKSMYGPLLGRR